MLPHEKVSPAQIGDWWAVCCRLDLRLIADQEELEAYQEWLDEAEEIGRPMLWATKEEALLDLPEEE